MEDSRFEEKNEPCDNPEPTENEKEEVSEEALPHEAEEAPKPSYGVSYTPGENGYDCRRYGESLNNEPERVVSPPKKKGKIALLACAIVMAVAVCAAVSIGGYITFSSLIEYNPGYGGSESVSDSDPVKTPEVPSTEGEGNSQQIPVSGGAIIYKNTDGYDYVTGITEMISTIKDTVVEIRTEKTVSSIYYGNYTQSGAGSGVILMRDGQYSGVYYIVTNNHVIDGADEIEVSLTDGSTYKAELVGTDSFSDIALIVIQVEDGRELPCAQCGDSEDLLLGQEIYAIGNPLGTLGGSVSRGIISCTERKISVDGMSMTLLQIDAAVNPGNSGGALFDAYGNLVGIVNAKYSEEGIEGLGFAIPINRAIEVVNELYVNGYVTGRATLKLSLTDRNYNMNGSAVTRPTLLSDSDVVCTYTDEDGKTASFTLAAKDIINSVSGVTVSSYTTLMSLLAEYEVGDVVELEVYRYEKTGTTTDWFGHESDTYGYVRYTVKVTLVEYVPE